MKRKLNLQHLIIQFTDILPSTKAEYTKPMTLINPYVFPITMTSKPSFDLETLRKALLYVGLGEVESSRFNPPGYWLILQSTMQSTQQKSYVIEIR